MDEEHFERHFPVCRRSVIGLIAAAAFLNVAVAGFGQELMLEQYKPYDHYRYLPRLPQPNENPPPLPDKTPEVEGDPRVLINQLSAIVFVDSPEMVAKTAGPETGIVIRSEHRLQMLRSPAFYRMVEPYLSGPISMLRLNEMAREIILFYRHNDQPVVDVSFPEQDLTDGILHVVVTEARVGKVCVDNACYFNPKVLARQLCISPGDPIHESVLLEEQRWLYQNPFRTVDIELTPGANRGETDVFFHVHDRRPVRVYAGYEDTGTRQTGLERTIYGVDWYNTLWRDDKMGYQCTSGADFDKFNAHSAFYTTALPNRDLLALYWGYGTVKSPMQFFDQTGYVWQLLPRWYRELCHSDCFELDVSAGFDVKQSNTNLEFGGVQVFTSPYDVRQFVVGCTTRVQDRWGSSTADVDGFYSPGHWGMYDNTTAYNQVRAFSDPTYFYTRGYFERRVDMPQRFELVARIIGQVASTNLMPTEQLGFGGYNSIRGYDMYDVIGDSGYFVNLEIYTPRIYALEDDNLRFLVFYDFGNAYNHTLLPGEPTTTKLSSVGAGARYYLKPNVEVRFDYGWQLDELAMYPTPRQRAHVGAVVSW